MYKCEFPLDYDEITAVLNPADFIGRSAAQVEEFISSLNIGETNTEEVKINV